MADLLIKGMKMPQNCDECSFVKMESEFHGICTAIRNNVCYVYPDKEKPQWCPLVEVPIHGRLVDWDEVKNCIEEIADSDIKQYALFLVSWAAEKRVVIKASEVKNEVDKF